MTQANCTLVLHAQQESVSREPTHSPNAPKHSQVAQDAEILGELRLDWEEE